jgi:hypothetical protein
MQHVLHVKNTGRDTTAYELIIIYIKPNCISSKFQISRANPMSQTSPPIYIMQRLKREVGEYLHKDAGNDFPHFSHPKSTDLGPESGGVRPAVAVRGRLGRGWERKKGRRRKKGAARALLTQRYRAWRGGAARLLRRCMWRGRPRPTPAAHAAASQRGTAATPLHVAWQRLPATPRR